MKNQPVQIVENCWGFIKKEGSFYLINDENFGLVVVDTGYPGSSNKLFAFLETIEKKPQDIKFIFLTHADGDHISCVDDLTKNSQACVFVSKQTFEYIKKKKNPPHWPFPINILASLATKLFVKTSKSNFVEINDMEVVNIAGGIQAVFTPGHTPDHMSYLWLEKNILFAGDTLSNFKKLDIPPQLINHSHVLNKKKRRKNFKT